MRLTVNYLNSLKKYISIRFGTKNQEIRLNNIKSQTIDPIVIKRVRGGFLAISPRKAPISLGAIAETESAARHAFGTLIIQWAHAREAELAEQSSH